MLLATLLFMGEHAETATFLIGGDLRVQRLGLGTMRLTGRGIWGPPEDPDECRAVLRRAVELGVDSSIQPTLTVPMWPRN